MKIDVADDGGFDDFVGRYWIDGHEAPSVTKIIEGMLRFAGASPEVIKAACQRGTAVHHGVELKAKGVPIDPRSVDPRLVGYFTAYDRFVYENHFEAFAAEEVVGHADYMYAGRIDLIGKLRTCPLGIFDIKATAAVPLTVGVQTAGYAWAYARMVDLDPYRLPRFCLHLKPNGTYKLVEKKSVDDWNVFASALNVKRWFHDNRQPL